MLLKDKKVAIIGGGPVGLTTAKILHQKGIDVTIYERDLNAQSRVSWGTLDIHITTGQIALEKAGILEIFYQNSRPIGERQLDTQGNVLEENLPTEENQHEKPEIDRNDFRRIFLENLHPDTVVWDSQLIDITKKKDQYNLNFKNGTKATADFVIVANGGSSNARKFVTDIEPRYTGTFIIQGEVLDPLKSCPSFKKLCGNENTGTGAEGKFFYTQTKSKGALNYFISFRADENWAEQNNIIFSQPESVKEYLNKITKNWHPTFKELFDATDNFTGLPMRRMYLDQPWKSQSDITLIGDAAHLMPPFAGIGVNIGLLDALHLSTNLTECNFPDTLSAVRDYEQKMYVYAHEAQQQTAMAEEMIHSDDEENEDERKRAKEEWDNKLRGR